jgi:hypothetical protein
MRLLALLLLLAVLPTVEVTEQIAHVVEHAFSSELADHAAHHEETPGEEHGCTSLIHLCGSHHAPQITISIMRVASRADVSTDAASIGAPHSLVDLTTPEPLQRPPIG